MSSFVRVVVSVERPTVVPLWATSRTRLRRHARGMTLVEILIVMGIIVLVMGGVVLGTGQLASARLKQSASLLTSAVRTGYAKANATSKSTRLVMDLDEQRIWLEESETPMLVQTKDLTGTGGANPITATEQAAVAEGQRIVKGPAIARPQFHAIAPEGGQLSDHGARGAKPGRSLSRGIKFRSVQALHDDQPRTSGRAYLYFWPGGQTERAVVTVGIDGEPDDGHAVTLVVSPLTGKTTMKPGSVSLDIPTDDKSASERDEPGGI